jgi:hypothetical protein
MFIKIYLFILIGICWSQNNTFIRRSSNQWFDDNNWSLGHIPKFNETAILNHSDVEMNLTSQENYYLLKNLILTNHSTLFIHVNMNISDYLTNQDSSIIVVINRTLYVCGNQDLYSGIIYLYKAILIPQEKLIIDNRLLVSDNSFIISNVENRGILELRPHSVLNLVYTYNFTQTETGTLILYGFPSPEYYRQQYIYLCYNAKIEGTLKIGFGGKIGLGKSIGWLGIIPSSMVDNHYNFNHIISDHYRIIINTTINQILTINLWDL